MGFLLAVLAFPLTIFLMAGGRPEAGMAIFLFMPTYGAAILLALLAARMLTIGKRATGAAQIGLFGLCFVVFLGIELVAFYFLGRGGPNFPAGIVSLAQMLLPIFGLPTLASWVTYAAVLWLGSLKAPA